MPPVSSGSTLRQSRRKLALRPCWRRSVRVSEPSSIRRPPRQSLRVICRCPRTRSPHTGYLLRVLGGVAQLSLSALCQLALEVGEERVVHRAVALSPVALGDGIGDE